jgi:hypothetical protein
MAGIPCIPEPAMTKPSNEIRELNRSTQELCTSELDAVTGGINWKIWSVIMKAQSETLKSISQNLR